MSNLVHCSQPSHREQNPCQQASSRNGLVRRRPISWSLMMGPDSHCRLKIRQCTGPCPPCSLPHAAVDPRARAWRLIVVGRIAVALLFMRALESAEAPTASKKTGVAVRHIDPRNAPLFFENLYFPNHYCISIFHAIFPKKNVFVKKHL